MVISAYQVNNVLRVYHDQLRNSRTSARPVNNKAQSLDRVTISSNAKQKAISDKIASSIADKINGCGIKDETGSGPLNENELQVQSNPVRDISSDLLFKMIDDEGETIKMLNIEDIKHSDNSVS